MVEFLSENINEIFDELVEQGREQGVTDQEAYSMLIENVIEEARGAGEIDDDGATETMEEMLRGRWEEFQERLGLNEKNPQL